mmetsp:Transcript_32168/g.88221  ORF Transcript_32168/g.88221 Transcript_32168/m.88221 type:complete len:578 (+) Transcript_32168:59-1792(+)
MADDDDPPDPPASTVRRRNAPSAAERERRIQKEDRLRELPAPEDEEELPAWVGWACCGGLLLIIGVLIAVLYRMTPARDAFDVTKVVKFDQDQVLRTVVWPKPGERGRVSGPNGKDTDWAIFFYKPYCPACRRVWPVFRALGNTVNSSTLRFGEVDCVKNRGVCTMVKAEKHPLIRLYKAVPTGKGDGWKREGAAEWQGLLIAYEIMQWFIDKQGEGLIGSDVEWPSPDRLGQEMRALKATGKVSHESAMEKRPADPGGYISDAELALQYGLIDHVMSGSADGSEPEISGPRLTQLLQWISLQSEIFPRAAVRDRLSALFRRLQTRNKWKEKGYEKALKAAGFKTTPVPDAAWRWCTPPANAGSEVAPALGGYTCGLWLLFHTTLANSDRVSAPDVLKHIRGWVGEFFGCSYCAAHFVDYYNENGGARVRDHINAVIWLWRAHNDVTMRLRRDEVVEGAEDRGGAPRRLWPSLEACKTCYKEEARGNESIPSTVTEFEENEEQWDIHTVFEYHQEVFCFESDTFVCSGFDDPSKDPESRKQHQDAMNVTAKAAKADAIAPDQAYAAKKAAADAASAK